MQKLAPWAARLILIAALGYGAAGIATAAAWTETAATAAVSALHTGNTPWG